MTVVEGGGGDTERADRQMHSQRGSRICNSICSDSVASFLFALQEASGKLQAAGGRQQAVSHKLLAEAAS